MDECICCFKMEDLETTFLSTRLPKFQLPSEMILLAICTRIICQSWAGIQKGVRKTISKWDRGYRLLCHMSLCYVMLINGNDWEFPVFAYTCSSCPAAYNFSGWRCRMPVAKLFVGDWMPAEAFVSESMHLNWDQPFPFPYMASARDCARLSFVDVLWSCVCCDYGLSSTLLGWVVHTTLLPWLWLKEQCIA